MKLSVGQAAPLFDVQDIWGRPVRLSAYRGKKTFLGFFRNTSCPFCNIRLHQLMRKADVWKDKLEMIFVFESQKEVMLRSNFHTSMSPVPLVSDPDKKLYQLYGVEQSWTKFLASHYGSKYQQVVKTAEELGFKSGLPAIEKGTTLNQTPADFLIDERLNIHTAYYSKTYDDRLPIVQLGEFAGVEVF